MRLPDLSGLVAAACLLLTGAHAEPEEPWSQWAQSNPGWVEPVEPFRIAGNLFYVGTKGLGVFFLPTEEGHILIDGGMPGYEDQIAASIEALGYRAEDIRILLNTHAHFDHSGGLADLKQRAHAELWASEGDRSALEGGFYLGSEDDPTLGAPPVAVDKVIADGDEIRLGGTTLTARLTPGHSRGCTSWWLTVEEAGEPLDVLIFCSATVAANRLAGPPQYDGIAQDYRYTFETARDWAPDIFLANHPGFSNLFAEQKKAAAGEGGAWRNGTDFTRMMARLEESFEKELVRQTGEAADD